MIIIDSKRRKRENILKKYPDAVIADVTSQATDSLVAKTEHSHPLGMVVSTHFRCGKGVKRGLKNGALPFNID